MTDPASPDKRKDPRSPRADDWQGAAIPAMVMLGAFYIGAAVLWGLHWTRGRAACDQYEYHLKAILKFAGELPRPDLHDYLSATTPGYHLLMAGVARVVSSNALFLQVFASVMTAALLVVVAKGMAGAGKKRERNWLELTALALPVAFSPYVFTSGVWLLPDNAGWVLALIIVLGCARLRQTSSTLMFAGLMFALLMVVRQSHVWAAAPVVAAGWLSATGRSDASIAGVLQRPARRIPMTLVAALACVPGVVVLAAFARMWHGLTPPMFQQQHVVQSGSMINWATPPFILSLIGLFSIFYLGWAWTGVEKMWRESRPLMVLVAIGALVWAAIPETTFLREPRSGGLWGVVGVLESAGMVIGHHTSPVILMLAPIGAVALAGWLRLIDDKRRWIAGAAVAAFVATQSANANCWQRYHEPFLLMFFALLAAAYGAGSTEPGNGRWPALAGWRIVGPLVLAGVLGVVTIGGVLYGRDPLRPAPEQSPVPAGRDPGR